MQKYCQVCVGWVESEGHTHPEKACQVCHQVKKLTEFPEHASSIDGHRHTCSVCVEQEKAQQKIQRKDYRIRAAQQRIERQAKQEQENALFHAYGYRWKKEMVESYDDWEEAWYFILPLVHKLALRMRFKRLPGFRYTSLAIPARYGQMMYFRSLIRWC
jgi:hypothetical protein